MACFKWTGFLVTASALFGVPLTFVGFVLLALLILDVSVAFLNTDIVQTYICEKEKTKRCQLTGLEKEQKKDHKS